MNRKIWATLILASTICWTVVIADGCTSNADVKQLQAQDAAARQVVVSDNGKLAADTAQRDADIKANAPQATIDADNARIAADNAKIAADRQAQADLDAKLAASIKAYNAAIDARVAQIDAGSQIVAIASPLAGPYGALFSAVAGLALGLWRAYLVKQRALDTIEALSPQPTATPGAVGVSFTPGVVVHPAGVSLNRYDRQLVAQAHGGRGLPF